MKDHEEQYERLCREFDRIRKLEENWDSYGASACISSTVDNAKWFIENCVPQNRLARVRVRCDRDGHAVLAVTPDTGEAELTFERTGHLLYEGAPVVWLMDAVKTHLRSEKTGHCRHSNKTAIHMVGSEYTIYCDDCGKDVSDE